MCEQSNDADHPDEWDGTPTVAELQRGPKSTRQFVDQLLLSIIDAHPAPGVPARGSRWSSDREMRLRAAKRALFAAKPTRISHDDGPALVQMAMERSKEYSLQVRQSAHKLPKDAVVSYDLDKFEIVAYTKASGDTRFRAKRIILRDPSERDLARRAANKTFGASIPAMVDRLRREFAKSKRHYQYLVEEHDFVDEMIERGVLAQLREIFADAGIRMKLPKLPGGKDSLADP